MESNVEPMLAFTSDSGDWLAGFDGSRVLLGSFASQASDLGMVS